MEQANLPLFARTNSYLMMGLNTSAEICEDCLGGYFIVSTSPLNDSEVKLTGSIYIARGINECKRAEEALRQSEQRIRLKLGSILSPAMEIANLELADIIDIQVIQSLMDDFYKLTHIPIEYKRSQRQCSGKCWMAGYLHQIP